MSKYWKLCWILENFSNENLDFALNFFELISSIFFFFFRTNVKTQI